MRLFIAILLLFVNTVSFAQADSTALREAVQRLDRALIEKDSNVLHAVLHPGASYGHSNGWVQQAREVIADGYNGKLTYKKLEHTSFRIHAIDKRFATVQTVTGAEGILDGKPFQLKLHVMQVWVMTEKGWQLLMRQSAKL